MLPPGSRYAMDRLHAEGGIGRVWLARDTQLNRFVAMKTLRPELLGHGRVRSRFLQEAQITGQLEHPGIVPVYEVSSRPADRRALLLHALRSRPHAGRGVA